VNAIPPIVDNRRRHRLEVSVEGHVAELVYRRDDQRLVIEHTGVPPELEGRGIGGALVTAAIDDAVERGLRVVLECPFARGWLERHPDVGGRVALEWPDP
jgi:uncharacterized protein